MKMPPLLVPTTFTSKAGNLMFARRAMTPGIDKPTVEQRARMKYGAKKS